MFIQIGDAWFKTVEIRSVLIDEYNDECIEITFTDGESRTLEFGSADECAEAMDKVDIQMRQHKWKTNDNSIEEEQLL